MSDNQFSDLFDAEPPEGVEPKWYRDQMDKAKAKVKELTEQIDQTNKTLAEGKVKSFVAEKGLSEEAIELIGDSDPEQWFKKFGHLVKTTSDPAEPAGDEDPPNSAPKGDSSLPPEQIAALQGVGSVTPGSFNPADHDAVVSQTKSAAENAGTIDDFWASLREQGALAEGV